MTCPACGGTGNDLLAIEEPDVFDGVLYWVCLVCGHPWHTWPAGHPRAVVAAAHVAAALAPPPDWS